MEISKQILYKLQSSVAFFNNFSIEELISLLKVSKKEVFYKDACIFKENTYGDNMYIIVSGSVDILRNSKGTEKLIVTLTSGSCFGEMGLIDDSPRSATAKISTEKAEVLTLSEKILQVSNVRILYKLYRGFSEILTQRLRETNQKFSEISLEEQSTAMKLKTVVKRIADSEKGSLNHANLSGANLSEVFFNHSNLERSLFIQADLGNARIKDSNLSSSNYTLSTFSECMVQGCDFSASDFTATKFEKVIFRDCKFNNSNMKSSFASRTLTKDDGLTQRDSKDPQKEN